MQVLVFQIGLPRLASYASFGRRAPASPVNHGQGFAIREGGRTVGSGTVTKILK